LPKLIKLIDFFVHYEFGALVSRKSGWNIFCSSPRRKKATPVVTPNLDWSSSVWAAKNLSIW